MNKLLKVTLLYLFLASSISMPAFCNQKDPVDLDSKIQSVGYKKIDKRSAKSEIYRLFRAHSRYTNAHQLEDLKNLYSDSYKNSDGFDKQVYFDMVKKTWNLYPDVRYYTFINDSYINDNYAVVQTKEYAIGKTPGVSENIKGQGLVQSESSSLYYLEKIGSDWKITSNSIIYEKTTLKYGDARWLDMTLEAPALIQPGQEYTATLKIDTPSNVYVLASLTAEPIVYPQAQPKEVFRTVKKDGVLERIFRANKDNLNEYSVASIGITKASITNPSSININITGMAFIMTRVNTTNGSISKIAKVCEAQNETNVKN